MDIAAMSTMLSQIRLQQEVGISVLKLAMEEGKIITSNGLSQQNVSNIMGIERSVNPNIGGNIDISL